jgi:ribosomal protein L29
MKKKDIQDLKVKSEAELARLVAETNDKIRALRFDLAAGKVKNVNELRQARKKVARMKTFMKQK